MKIFLLFFVIAGSALASDELQIIKEEKIVAGLDHKHFVRKGSEPLSLHLLNIDLDKISLKFQLAKNEILGRETVSSIVKRSGATGGINGGFFELYGPYQGDPEGLYVSFGKILSEPIFNRSSFGICKEDDLQNVVVDQVKVDTYLVFNGKRKRVLGLNRERKSDDIVVYMPEFGHKTLTDDSGAEIIVKNGVVSEIISAKGSSIIPKDGMVISASGKFKKGLIKDIKSRLAVKLTHEVRSIRRDGEKLDLNGCSFTTAGPTLIMKGSILPKFRNVASSERAPRTAIGVNDRKEVVIVVVDGREPEFSVGMSLGELANFLKSQWVSEGYNLDGGGSTTLVLKGKTLNRPSDVTGERAVGDAILFFPRSFH